MQKVTFSGKSNFIIVNSHDIPNYLDNFAVRNAFLEIIHSLSSLFIQTIIRTDALPVSQLKMQGFGIN